MNPTALATGTAALPDVGNRTQASSSYSRQDITPRVPVMSVNNRRPLSATTEQRMAPGNDTCTDSLTLDLDQVSHSKLDELSNALTAGALSSAALIHLIQAGFHNTVLAKPMAEWLVGEALPGLVDTADGSYPAWRDILTHALALPRDQWEIQCIGLRTELPPAVASKSPLLAWLRDALYRPECVSFEVWHRHMARMREADPDVDAQSIALAYQKTAIFPDQKKEHVQEHLRRLLPTLSDAQVAQCMDTVRRHMRKDRTLLDVRIALTEAFEHVSDKNIRSVHVELEKQRGRGDDALRPPVTNASGIGITGVAPDPTAALLLEVGKDARLAPHHGIEPVGQYNTLAHALVSLLYWPGQLPGAFDATASTAFAAEYLVSGADSSLVPRALEGVWSAPGWMRPTGMVRHPPRHVSPSDSEGSANHKTAPDLADFNNGPEGPGIVLETFESSANIYPLAGYVRQEVDAVEAFLSRQPALADIISPDGSFHGAHPATDAYIAFQQRPAAKPSAIPSPACRNDFRAPSSGTSEAAPSRPPEAHPAPIDTSLRKQHVTPQSKDTGFLNFFPAADAAALSPPELARFSGELLSPNSRDPGYWMKVLESHLKKVQQRLPHQASPPHRPVAMSPAPTFPDPLDARGDLRILSDTLRQLQGRASTAPVRTDQTFVPVSMHSLTARYVADVAPVLTHLKLSLTLDGTLPEPYGSMEVDDRGGIRSIKQDNQVRRDLDLSKPLSVTTQLRRVRRAFHLFGTNTGGVTKEVKLTGAAIFGLTGYKAMLDKFDITELTSLDSLEIRDDGQVSIQSLLRFYGVTLPDRATSTDLSAAVDALRPRAELIASAADEKPPVVARPFSVDTLRLPVPIKREFDGGETSDYGFISRKIKDVCDEAYRAVTNDLRPNEEKLILGGLKNCGGIALQLDLDDTDGEDNHYTEQQIVNPKNGTLRDYFDNVAQLLGDYMINKIKSKDGENEGDINIATLKLALYTPNFVKHDQEISNREARIFDIRSETPPFRYVDTHTMSSKTEEAISRAIGGMTDELRASDGDILKCGSILEAARRMIEEDKISLVGLPETEQASKIREVIDDVLRIYYRISSVNLEKLQRLLITQQPGQAEFLSRVICRHLGMDELNWPIIASHEIVVSYETGLLNQGRFTKSNDQFRGTLLELIYDQKIRTEIGLAANKDAALVSLAAQISKACLTQTCKVSDIDGNLSDYFRAYSTGIAGGVSIDPLPDAIAEPGEAFAQANHQYIEDAIKTYRQLEAERMVLTSPTVIDRLGRANGSAVDGSSTDIAIDFHTLLDDLEKRRLDDNIEKFRDFLAIRRNLDAYRNQKSWLAQVGGQLKDAMREVCRNAPSAICPPFLLVDSLVEGADAETTVMDAVSFISSRLGGLRNVPMRRLGGLMGHGADAWSLKQNIESYYQAVKDGKHKEAHDALLGILEGGQWALACGASVAKKLRGRVTRERFQAALSRAVSPDSVSKQQPARSPESQAATRYWSINPDGAVARSGAGKAVIRSLHNGDLVVQGAARATKLSDGLYMLGGIPHQAVRMPSGKFEILPMSSFSLCDNSWSRIDEAPRVVYARPEASAFPRTFSGPADGSSSSSRGPVSWFDNRRAVFERIDVQSRDANGESGETFAARIGVIEHKYVLDRDGTPDILEHGGTRDGRTTFIRNDGSTFIVARNIPPTPRYKPEIEATVSGMQSMFAVVKVTEGVDGLKVKATVSGVVGARHDGEYELIIELDAGTYYRGSVSAQALAGREPFKVLMNRISADADPKRASPSLWDSHGAYRDGPAEGDFALELYEGARFANRAYGKNPDWVRKQHGHIAAIRQALPPEVRTTMNPYYKLRTSEADAILFAPRNRAALADTLIGQDQDVVWNTLSSVEDITRIERSLRTIEVIDPGSDGGPERSPLLAASETIPVDTRRRLPLHARLKEKIGGRNLVLVEVETTQGKKQQFADIQSLTEAGILVTSDRLDPFKAENEANPGVTVKCEGGTCSVSTGSVIGQIQSAYPDPSVVAHIRVFSLDPLPRSLAEDIFTSSGHGYRYEKLLGLIEHSDGDLSGPAIQPHTAATPDIHPASIDLSNHTPIAQGARRGAYKVGHQYYVPLESGVYLAAWDAANKGFRLLPPRSHHRTMETLPLVRRISGKLQLAEPAGSVTDRAAPSPADMRRLQRALEKNPTPPILQTINQHGTDVVMVADPARVSEKLELDGSWILMVDGVEYRPALTEANTLAYVRKGFDDDMTVGCGGRFGRAIEPLCTVGAKPYFESKQAVKAEDLPLEGTDQPDTEAWTPWSSDTRVYGSKIPEHISKALDSGKKRPAQKDAVAYFVPYEGKYHKLSGSKRSVLNTKQLQQSELPERPAYQNRVPAQLLRRQGHGAQLRIDNFDAALTDSKLEIGASIFRRKGLDEEWLVTQYDGTWYLGTVDRPTGSATPSIIQMEKMQDSADLTQDQRKMRHEIQRLHAGMQNTNYHAKASSPEAMKDILDTNRRLGVTSKIFDASEYFETSTTADQAFLFDRLTRENVQVRARKEAGWSWLQLGTTPANDRAHQSQSDLLNICKTVFAKPDLTIEGLLNFSADKKGPVGAKNFLLFRVNGSQIYLSLSGEVSAAQIPAIFKDDDVTKPPKATTTITLNGKEETITFVNLVPESKSFRDKLDKSSDYPRALPTAARPDQIELNAIDFSVTLPRTGDAERIMIAHLTQGGRPEGIDTIKSLEVLNRNDACKSCATTLQHLFSQLDADIVHFYGNEYPEY